jgi:hypothetical protein
MRRTINALCVLGMLTLAAAFGMARTASPSADNPASIVVIFQDGHRQSIAMTDIARIDFKTPVIIVFKDGRQQNIPATDVARIEFEPATSPAARNRFVGKWQVGEGNGSNFYITLEADGQARKSIGESHGTWTVVAGEARISWDDGWHDAICKVGASHEKRAYEPGKSFSDAPSNVTAARNTEPKPI